MANELGERIMCSMCEKEIYYSPDYLEYLHLINGSHYCPNKTASIATPPWTVDAEYNGESGATGAIPSGGPGE